MELLDSEWELSAPIMKNIIVDFIPIGQSS
jgi:hypothetical protein